MTTVKLLRGAAASAAASRTALERIRPPPISSVWKYSLELTIVFASYFVAGQVGFAVPFTTGNVSPVWPPAGIALAALLLVGYRVWPAIAAGAFLVNFLSPISLVGAIALAAGNTAGPMVGAWLVQRFPGFRPALSRLDDVLGLMLIAAPVGAVISATIGVTVLFITHVNPWFQFWPAWLVWWLGDTLGVLIVTPLALTLLKQKRLTQARHLPELVALLAAVVVTCFVIFDTRTGLGIEKDVLAFAVLPLVLWGATRFQIPGAAGVTLLIAFVTAWETANGFGPFVRNTTLQNATMLQAFIAVIAVSGLTLAAVIVERAQLIREQTQREGLEQSERRYREIVETANDGIWMLDARLMTVFVNPRMAEILGYTVDEMSGNSVIRIISPRPPGSRSRWGSSAAGQPSRSAAQTRIEGRTGRRPGRPSHKPARSVRTARSPACSRWSATSAIRRRAEHERQQALHRLVLLSNAVEQTADSVLISDSAGRIEYVNPAFEGTTGFTREEALGKHAASSEVRAARGGVLPRDVEPPGLPATRTGAHWSIARNRANCTGPTRPSRRSRTARSRDPLRGRFQRCDRRCASTRSKRCSFVLARAVQQRFYPSPPRLPGFDIAAASDPAAETGGDYFDFIEAPNGVLYVAIGDVSGHGFDAALIMALTRAYMRSFATLGMDVGEVLGRVNRAIVGDLEPDRYVTMLLVRLDVQAREPDIRERRTHSRRAPGLLGGDRLGPGQHRGPTRPVCRLHVRDPSMSVQPRNRFWCSAPMAPRRPQIRTARSSAAMA